MFGAPCTYGTSKPNVKTKMRKTACLLLLATFVSLAHGQSTRRPVATYSIVARDAATGQLGVAVQSHWFSVGALVPWAEPGVGAVATQSFVDPAYGPLGLELRARSSRPTKGKPSGRWRWSMPRAA